MAQEKFRDGIFRGKGGIFGAGQSRKKEQCRTGGRPAPKKAALFQRRQQAADPHCSSQLRSVPAFFIYFFLSGGGEKSSLPSDGFPVIIIFVAFFVPLGSIGLSAFLCGIDRA